MEDHRTISPEYQQLNSELHSNPRYGCNSARHLTRVTDALELVGGTTVLDYGCGKGGLVREIQSRPSLGIDIQGYDPAIPEFSDPPRPADLVISTDVLEHIEPELLRNVLTEINSMAGKAIIYLIALRLDSTKLLPDGTNPHKIVKPWTWWVERLVTVHKGFSIEVLDRKKDHHVVFRLIKTSEISSPK